MDLYTTSFCIPQHCVTPHQPNELPPRQASYQQGGQPYNGHDENGHGQHSRPTSVIESPTSAHFPSGGDQAGESSANRTSPPAQAGVPFPSAESPKAEDANLDEAAKAALRGEGAGTRKSVSSGMTVNTDTSVERLTNTDGTTRTTTTSTASSTATAAANARTVQELTEGMQKMTGEVMSQHQCMVQTNKVDFPNRLDPSMPQPNEAQKAYSDEAATANAGASNVLVGMPPGQGFHYHLSGGYQQVMGARGAILRDAPFKRKSVVKVPRSEVLDAKENVKAEMRRKLDEIASLTKAHLALVGQMAGQIGFGLETERNVEIVITGSYESVEQARVRLLVLLDELSGLHSEVCEIDYKLHNIIAGRKRCVIQTIQEETGTNIYFPSPLSGVLGAKVPGLMAKQNLIFITGEFFGVQRARDMLFQVSMHKSKCIISRDAAILPRKLDWILTERLEEVKLSMNDNGTFINFPVVGSQASLISVYGDHRVNIERTIRSIMQMACQFYVASFWLLPASFDVFMPPPTINPAQVPAILEHISITSGAEAVFKSSCFELHGLESEVRTAVQLVLELDLVKAFHHEIRFQIELANEHREFISGKKNGKLNKVMKTANVKIKFETFNDYNFLIDIAGNDIGALQGLSMLQEELPAEVSFHVPEAYHKRIIGVGGKNIQRIMKKYGVYVKFSNAEEFAALGGYLDNDDNVVARTPAKNAFNLEYLKQSVMELVNPRDKDFVVEAVNIPRRYHRTLLGEKSIFIHDIEAKTNSIFRFPNKESASDVVHIFGPESQIHIAVQMLLVHIPFEAEMRLPHSQEMSQLVLGTEWVTLIERIKHDLNITILPWVDRSGNGEETVLKFCLNRSNMDFLGTARDQIEDALTTNNITMYPGTTRPRGETLSDPFIHFNSALLSGGSAASRAAATNAAAQRAGENPGAASNNMPLPAEGDSRYPQPQTSAQNIKALFDGPERYQDDRSSAPSADRYSGRDRYGGGGDRYSEYYQQGNQQGGDRYGGGGSNDRYGDRYGGPYSQGMPSASPTNSSFDRYGSGGMGRSQQQQYPFGGSGSGPRGYGSGGMPPSDPSMMSHPQMGGNGNYDPYSAPQQSPYSQYSGKPF